MTDYFCRKGNTDVDNLLMIPCYIQYVYQDSNRYLHSPNGEVVQRVEEKALGKFQQKLEFESSGEVDSCNGRGGISAQKIFFN